MICPCDIETHISTRINPNILGKWSAKQRRITLNAAGCWREADQIVAGWRGYPSPDPGEEWFPCHDLIADVFCEVLADTYLIERICFERYFQRIRLRRNRCEPCCIQPLMEAMHNHIGQEYEYTSRKAPL